MHSIAGKIAGSAIIAEPQELAKYEGCDVVITILPRSGALPQKESIDFDSYCTETVRGKNVDEYLLQLRSNDRI